MGVYTRLLFISAAITSPCLAKTKLSDAEVNAALLQRIEALEAKIKKLENESVLVLKKDVKTDELPKPIVSAAPPKSSVKLSGQVNRLAAYRDNGDKSRFEHLDSTASSTRVNITGTSEMTQKVKAQAVIETELTDGVQSFSSDADIGSASVGSAFSNTSSILRNRRLEVVLQHENFGTLFVGKGHTSSDGVSEVDFTGTNMISNASEGPNNLGGFRFFNKTLNASANQRTASDAFRNMDGLQRANRIRYDTPSFSGFIFAATHTNSDQTDQSIKYAASIGKLKIGAAAAHTYQPSSTATINNVVYSRRHHTYHGSFAVLYNGFSFGAAGGIEKYPIKSDANHVKRKPASFWFIRGGYQRQIINCGITALAIDYTKTKATALLENNFDLVNRERGQSYAMTIVQNFDSAGAEVYMAARQYQFDQPRSTYKKAIVAVIGTRVKF